MHTHSPTRRNMRKTLSPILTILLVLMTASSVFADSFASLQINPTSSSQTLANTPNDVFTALGTIGDTIWGDFDEDGDGILDGTDVPFEGVVVTLTPPSDIDLGAGPGVPITDVTDANGMYLFESVPADNTTYTITIF